MLVKLFKKEKKNRQIIMAPVNRTDLCAMHQALKMHDFIFTVSLGGMSYYSHFFFFNEGTDIEVMPLVKVA